MDDSHRNRIQALMVSAGTESPTRDPNGDGPDLLVVPRTCRSEWERPPLLGFITLLGITGPISGFLLLWAIVWVFTLFGVFLTESAFEGIGDVLSRYGVLFVAGIVPFIGLRLGRSWGWVWVQVFCAIGFLIVPLSALSLGGGILKSTMAKIMALPFALLWLYLRTKRVKDFCSVGRAVRLSELESECEGDAGDEPDD